MDYLANYLSPLGQLLLASDGEALTGLWFAGQRFFAAGLSAERAVRPLPVFDETAAWLDAYFAGRQPGPPPALSPRGTPFQRQVWALLCAIPYGRTRSYGELSRDLAEGRSLPSMSAQAVGGAVARNPISILIPCHRVVGADGSLTGYAAGLERKRALLALEQGRGLCEGNDGNPARAVIE